jgi:hypothetical protein
MAGRLNRPAAANGVVAYQDYDNPDQFHYFPLRIDAVKGDTLKAFQVSYFGINAKPYWVDVGGRNYRSLVGGTLSGTAIPDITTVQRADITKAIQDRYQVKKPILVPMLLEEVSVQPIFAKHISEMGEDNSSTFPSRVTLGASFGYQVGSGNSLFSEMVGGERENSDPSPDFAVNMYGQCELYADPWVAEIHADLSRVWEYTRTQVNVGASLGWFNLGVNIDKITQELISKGIVTMKFRQGGGGKDFGWQMLNSTKTLFEAINKQVVSGEGLFKFEPNPTPQEPAKNDNWGAKLLPFTVSVNTSYVSNVFKQEITFDEVVTFEGMVPVLLSGSMSLALPCTLDTEKSFYDVQLKEQGCITKAKSDGLQNRISAEVAAKDAKIREYLKFVETGKWTVREYGEMLQLLNTITLTETPKVMGYNDDGSPIIEIASPDEVAAMLTELERTVVEGAAPQQRAAEPTETRQRVKL